MIHPLRILHAGCWPPPMGGVAIFVRRLAERQAAAGCRVKVFNESPDPAVANPLLLPPQGWARFSLHLLWHGTGILHVHSANLRFRCLLWLWRLRGCVVVVTLHTADPREQFGPAGSLVRRVVCWNLKRVDALVLAGEGARVGLAPVLAGWSNVHLIQSWVEPVREDKAAIVPESVRAFLGLGRPVLVANGAVRLRPEGDLYGFNQLLDMLSLLVDSGRDIGLLCYVSSISSQDIREREYYGRLRELSRRPPLEGRVHWHESREDEFEPVIRAAAVVLRPTLSESMGQTVIQALLAGRPVVASDAAPRQPGVLTFRTGDPADFAAKVVTALTRPAPPCASAFPDAMPLLMDLYVRLLGHAKSWD